MLTTRKIIQEAYKQLNRHGFASNAGQPVDICKLLKVLGIVEIKINLRVPKIKRTIFLMVNEYVEKGILENWIKDSDNRICPIYRMTLYNNFPYHTCNGTGG